MLKINQKVRKYERKIKVLNRKKWRVARKLNQQDKATRSITNHWYAKMKWEGEKNGRKKRHRIENINHFKSFFQRYLFVFPSRILDLTFFHLLVVLLDCALKINIYKNRKHLFYFQSLWSSDRIAPILVTYMSFDNCRV